MKHLLRFIISTFVEETIKSLSPSIGDWLSHLFQLLASCI